MDILRQLIQTIAVIVVLAVFLEMLLPRGDMRRYVKMVMGLLIIVAVLQTVADTVNSDLLQEIPDITHSADSYEPVSLDQIMAAGRSLTESNREAAAQKYSAGVAQQVLSLAGLNPDVNAVDARVLVETDTSAINSITLVFTLHDGDASVPGGMEAESGVQPVIIDTVGPDDGEENNIQPTENEIKSASRVASLVADFYSLRRDQVQVEFQ
ncbi:MAG: stage III sporulation protein AF [Firmicutes bacterium]|nr:stage III sporulation protein AF [Bacillota bacterium]